MRFRFLKIFIVTLSIATLLVSWCSTYAFAVDPISATAIANGFAQAITAYGAANGVSITFDGIDSNNTAQIGEAVHDLWSRFRADQQTTDDYLAIGEALMPSLFYKAEKTVGTAAIGIRIAQQYMPDIDAFWNWVLSGPAEMVKVDNAYQWNPDPNTGTISPISVYYGNTINGYSVAKNTVFNVSRLDSANPDFQFRGYPNTSQDIFAYYVMYNGNQRFVFFSISDDVTSIQYRYGAASIDTWSNWSIPYGQQIYTVGNHNYYFYSQNIDSTNNHGIPIAAMVNNSYSPKDVLGFTDSIPDPVGIDVSVAPYVGDAVAKPVPIPDTTDPDYGPITWVGDLDIPWIDTLFGDGTGVLTNEQTSDIIGTIDQAIVDNPDKTIELDTETDIPIDPPVPSEIIIPFLPVQLPSFNFSFSGIWHYVREWVTSLGSWFATMFTIWNTLPYAMIVPVYATAVVVIVLGVYKRFFM